jgi:hypothetical protein
MDPSSSSGKFTREGLTTAVKEYLARNPEMYQQLLSMNESELKSRSGAPLYEVFSNIRDESMGRNVETGRKLSVNNGDIHVVTKDGVELFVLDDGKPGSSTMTAKEIYDKGIQWFEPMADNYMRLKSMAPDIATNPKLKHFTWDQVASFATQDRWMTSYRSGGSGDWKKSKEGADGYFLITVGGKPYWADAVGQIPFAVNNATNVLKEKGDPTTAIKETITTGQTHGQGQLIGGTPDTSNTYDNYMIMRGAKWATLIYDIGPKTNGGYELKRRFDVPPERLANPIDRESATRYGLTNPLTRQ